MAADENDLVELDPDEPIWERIYWYATDQGAFTVSYPRPDQVTLTALGPSGKLETARKGGGHFLIAVSGVSAHTGLEPEKGVSAVIELSRLVQELHAMNDPDRGISINVGTSRGGDRARP